ncbi:hypothetical protein VitviT2T_021866 [Vitis vinifera]|uniref:Uncharacterized protein n=2 Tax=Vitis vinifera TaxID=29760 RepID=A0ABY9D8Y1_VITVI|eukprot:XP_002280667.2 PREDICTED: uncharacterized protein LOC100249788 [Vitis vinifera]
MATIEEDERREAAIASTPSLQSDFKPVGVTNLQLSKFQELHKRRLQIKQGSKYQKKSKDWAGKSYGKESKYLKVKDCTEENASITIEESSVSTSKSNNVKDKPSLQQGDIATHLASKKRQKLHWGLDTKERWERKANM